MWKELVTHEWDGPYYRERSADLTQVRVPLLSAANWGGHGLHARGNFEGFVNAASTQKWLEVHGGSHWAPFYTDYGVDLQKRFFDHFLKGIGNGWEKQPAVQLNVRHVDRFELRHENEWPLARTQWNPLSLDAKNLVLTGVEATSTETLSFDAMGDGITFLTEPFKQEAEITGPSSLRLWISSSTSDADIFVILRLFDPNGSEVVFQGALDPHSPLAHGWLRASHRQLDHEKSLPHRPYHTHTHDEPLVPGVPVQLDIEIWPTCIVIPPGYRLGLTVRGKDYEYGGTATTLSNMKNPMRGCGPFEHDDEVDRPPKVFGGQTTLHFGPGFKNTLLLPFVPTRE